MAKICFLLTTTPWDDRRQIYRQAPALAADGHEVIYMSDDPGEKVTERFTFAPLSARQRRRARMWGGLNLFRKITKHRPDAVHLCSLEQLPLGLVLKAFTEIKVIYDCREDMYNSMLYSKPRFPRIIRILLAEGTRFVERLAAMTFDGIVASDPAIIAIHSAMPRERKMIFYNTGLLSQFPSAIKPLAPRPYDIALLGGMARRSGILVLVDTLRILARRGRKISTLLIGAVASENLEIINQMVREEGLEDKIKITGRIAHLQVPAELAQAKLGMVMLLDLPKFQRNIACKAFEYMASGMPVITSDLKPEHLFIKEGYNGLFFEPGNAEAAADAITTLLDDLDRAQAMGCAGRKEVEEKWNGEREQEKLRLFYRQILRTRGRRVKIEAENTLGYRAT